MDIKKLNEELEKFLEEFERGNETLKPFIVQLDPEDDNLEELEVVGCDTLEEAEKLFDEWKESFKNDEIAKYLTLSKLEDGGYEKVKFCTLGEE